MGAFVANDDSPEEGRVAVAIGRFEVGALRMRRERNCDVFDQDLGDVHGGNGIAKTHRRHERSKPVGIGLVDKVVEPLCGEETACLGRLRAFLGRGNLGGHLLAPE